MDTKPLHNRWVITCDDNGYTITVNGKPHLISHATLQAVDAIPDTSGCNEGFVLTIGYDEVHHG